MWKSKRGLGRETYTHPTCVPVALVKVQLCVSSCSHIGQAGTADEFSLPW